MARSTFAGSEAMKPPTVIVSPHLKNATSSSRSTKLWR